MPRSPQRSLPRSLQRSAVLLLVVGVLAGPAAAEDCLKVKEIRTSYDALRLGSSMELQVAFETIGDCLLTPITGGHSSNPQYAMDVAASPGLSFRAMGFSFQRPTTRLTGFHRFEMTLRVEAAPDAKPGSRRIPALLRYAAEDGKGVPADRTLALDLPVELVPATAAVKPQSLAHKRPPVTPVDVLLIPVRVLDCVGEMLQKGNCGS